jgi:carbon monoxide dehydrogenase subunit G
VKPLEIRDLAWIDQAPVHLVATGSTPASPEAVFAILADHERWPEWFPGVKEVTVLGPAEGVGARRRVAVPGLVVEEEFIAWDVGQRWAFTGTSAKPALFRSIVEDCQLRPRADGGTDLTYGMHLGASAAMVPLLKVGGRVVRSNIAKALVALAARAERRS